MPLPSTYGALLSCCCSPSWCPCAPGGLRSAAWLRPSCGPCRVCTVRACAGYDHSWLSVAGADPNPPGLGSRTWRCPHGRLPPTAAHPHRIHAGCVRDGASTAAYGRPLPCRRGTRPPWTPADYSASGHHACGGCVYSATASKRQHLPPGRCHYRSGHSAWSGGAMGTR
jgi:hypothetical protein